MNRKLYKHKDKSLYKEQIARDKGYFISKDGVLFHNDKRINPHIRKTGYLWFHIRVESHLIEIPYHRLQAYQKYGDRIYKKGIVVRHLDNNKQNNSRNNIAIGTIQQNNLDNPKELRQRIAQTGGDANRKFNHENVIAMHNWGLSYKEIMEYTGIHSKGTISWIINHSTASKI
jgi:hypothetical protein